MTTSQPWSILGESVWDETVRSRLKAFHKNTLNAAHDIIRLAFSMMSGEAPLQLGVLVQAYLDGVGSYEDSTRYRLKQVTDEVGQRHGLLSMNESFFEHTWSLKPNVVQEYCPTKMPFVLFPRPNTGLEVTQALDPCPNELMDLRLPAPIGGAIGRLQRGPLRIYSTDDAIAYVHPFQYQLLSRDRASFWISGSPRSLSRASIPDIATQKIDKNVVVVQDRFGFSNLCHFIFDGVTRILHYVENFGASADDLFILGQIPGDYQSLVCSALAEHLGIPASNFVFPTGAHLLDTSRKCFWFSDQVEGHSHPAQMAHPRSVSALVNLCAKIPSKESEARRVYISRADADRRRVANEAELVAALEKRGFVSMQLAKLTALEQVALFRGANIVIGPHGMGLTHIIMGNALGRVIELFNPNAGTDAYAFIASAGGIQYDFVVGTVVPDTPSDFVIDVKRVIDLLGPDNLAFRRPSWHKCANLIPTSRTFKEFSSASSLVPDLTCQAMIWGQSTQRHIKESDSTEVGRWAHMFISALKTYTLSCWVWIPQKFIGEEVWIQIAEWRAKSLTPADLKLRDCWQRVWFTAESPVKDRCWAELHIRGPANTDILSTCWQLEVGPTPTAYVATG